MWILTNWFQLKPFYNSVFRFNILNNGINFDFSVLCEACKQVAGPMRMGPCGVGQKIVVGYK